MVDVPTTEPAEVTAGDTIKWKKSLSDYPASAGWTLSYVLINSTNKIAMTSTADGDDHLVSVAPAVSGAYTAGLYDWQAHVSDGTDRYSVGIGTTTVLPDISAVPTYDGRSYVKKALDAIEATLLKKATKDQQAMIMPYGGRRIDRYPIEDLLKWRDRLKAEYAQELRNDKLQQGIGGRRKILTRFVG